ncbi:MAG: ABC transporter ATP-binding protein [Vicinamibacterales bacterium]
MRPHQSSGTLRDILNYLRVFQSHVGWRMYLVCVLTLAATIAEGFGIVMVLPVLQTLDGAPGTQAAGADAESAAARALGQVLGSLGITSAAAMLALIACAFLLKGFATFGASAYTAYLKARFLRQDQMRLMDAYSRMEYLYYAKRNAGHFVSVITAQLAGFYGAFSWFVTFFAGVASATAYFTLALFVAWRFGLGALGIGAILLFVFRALNSRVRELSRKSAKENGHLTGRLIQFLHAFKYLTATQGAGHLQRAVGESMGRLRAYQVRLAVASAFTDSMREPLAVLFVVAIVLVQISVLEQPLAPIMVSIVLFNRGLNSILDLQGSLQKTLGLIGAAEVVTAEFDSQRSHQESDGSREIGPLTTGIEFRDVTFAYDPQIGDVLHGLSFQIHARTTVAFVGESGAGKSTVIDMLSLLLKPTAGSIAIDGVPAADVALRSWRTQIGYVSQETVVFDDTVANNICLWEGDAEHDAALLVRIRDAARRANIDTFIESLPEQYATRVGERGIRLSGGQRQRLFIARELFKQPRLLILDEATSALDSESERAIQASIDAVRGQMTVVIIAHRLSTIRNVDRVFVLDGGRLVEEGSYETLRRQPGSRFGAMVASQSLLPEERIDAAPAGETAQDTRPRAVAGGLD